jgi:hypothetical protein
MADTGGDTAAEEEEKYVEEGKVWTGGDEKI